MTRRMAVRSSGQRAKGVASAGRATRRWACPRGVTSDPVAAAIHIPTAEREDFAWRPPEERQLVDDADVLHDPSDAADAHLVPGLYHG